MVRKIIERINRERGIQGDTPTQQDNNRDDFYCYTCGCKVGIHYVSDLGITKRKCAHCGR